MKRRLYIVTYDICDPKRLRRVFKTMKGFGAHMQLSVFQCDLPAVDLVKLKAELREIINLGEDQVLIFDLGPTEGQPIKSIKSIGRSIEVITRKSQII